MQSVQLFSAEYGGAGVCGAGLVVVAGEGGETEPLLVTPVSLSRPRPAQLFTVYMQYVSKIPTSQPVYGTLGGDVRTFETFCTVQSW